MQNFHDTFETPKRSLMSAFSICMTVPLIAFTKTLEGPQRSVKIKIKLFLVLKQLSKMREELAF